MAESEAIPGDHIRFGEFEADLRSGELRKRGIRIRVQDQPFKVLVALLERPGEIVTREELRKRIWGEETFVEFDHGLNAAVNRLREALCDSADEPRYVETVARRGYRFIGTVEAQPAVSPVETPRKTTRLICAAAILAAAAVVVGAGWIHAWLGSRTGPMRVVELTALPGYESQPAISPDGKQVAFVWSRNPEDRSGIYVISIGSGYNPSRLTSPSNPGSSPAWSPDGSQIAFVRSAGGRGTIYLVSPLGGPERRLADSTPGVPGMLAWRPDGKLLAVAGLAADEPWGIFLLNVETGQSRRITRNEAGTENSLSFSPDGRRLAYASCQSAFACHLYVAELNPDGTLEGSPRRLTREGEFFRGTAWTGDGRSIIYSSSRDAGLGHYLRRIPASGEAQPDRLELAAARAAFPAVSRDGKLLAYGRSGLDSDIWSWQEGKGARSFIASTLIDDSPQYSPDGSRIAFASRRSGDGLEVWVCDRDGSNVRPLTHGWSRAQGTPRWSPDGRSIAFDSQGEDGHWDICEVNAAGGRPRRITTSGFDEVVPSYSRDGRWLYAASNRTGRYEIWRFPVSGGKAQQITQQGGFVAFESWDGKEIYYLKGGNSMEALYPLMVRSLAGGPERKVVDSVTSRAFVPLADGVYYIAGGGTAKSYSLQFYEFATNRSKNLAAIDSLPNWGLTVSPDRRTVLYSPCGPLESDLFLIENFR